MRKYLLLLLLLTVVFVGCSPESLDGSEPAEKSGVGDMVSFPKAEASNGSEDIFDTELQYTTVTFKSFEELAQLLLVSNDEEYNEYFEKDNLIPPAREDVADMFKAFSEMSIPVLETDEYELAIISCDIYFDGRYYIELVYNGETDRLRVGAHTLSGSASADDNVTIVVADTVVLGEYSIELKTMAKENNYCDIKGNYSADEYGIYLAYKGGTVLPDSLKQGLTLTTLEELIKPYIK